MKYFVLALFVAVATGVPIPDPNGEPVELIVNGVPEGQPLELGDIVDIKLKEHNDGVLASSTDLLHPLTAVGIAEAAAAAEAAQPEIVPIPVQIVDNEEEQPVPDVIAIIPIPETPEVNPEYIAIIPIPETEVDKPVPEIIGIIPIPETEGSEPQEVSPIELLPPNPEPEDIPSPIVLPEIIPEPAPQVPVGEVFNNGLVQVHVNGDPGMFSTIQSWFSMMVNYISNGIQTTQQIV